MTEIAQVPTAVLGGGAWGTALAALLARNGQPTCLWGRDAEKMAAMVAAGVNERYLPGIKLPSSLVYTSDLGDALAQAHDVLIVVPSKAFRVTLELVKPFLRPGMRIAWATKGFEPDSAQLLHEVVVEVLGRGYPAAIISGPTFAAEVAKGLPTAVTVASQENDFAVSIAQRLHNESFRAYTSSDVVGVEVGGAVKNILAIAAGISDGLGFGANARAALITRGLTEVMRLGEALGGHRETLMGLAGMGDLVLTCTDDQSRNRRFGLALGRGDSVASAHDAIKQVVEGMHAAKEVVQLARRLKIEMPITEQVYEVLYCQRDPHEAVHLLLDRTLKSESL